MSPFAVYDDISLASFSIKSDGKHPVKASSPEYVRISTKVDYDEKNDTVAEFEKIDEEMKHEIWYTLDEYDIIKARNGLIVKMMKTGTFTESEEHSFRGLEHKLREGHKQRRANKFNGLNCVLEEQDRQQARGKRDAEAIATVYRRIAQNARESAFVSGIKDSEHSYGYKLPPLPSMQVEPSITLEEDDDAMTDVASTEGSIAFYKKSSSKSKIKKFFGLGSNKNKLIKDTEHLQTAAQTRRRATRRASM
jgi:hypothetical protein